MVPVDFSGVAIPGLMISQVWPQSRETAGATLAALEVVLQDGFFHAVQTVEIPSAAERREVARCRAGANLPLTYCLARVLNEGKHNLSALEDSVRRRGVDCVRGCLDDARQSGARAVALVSGAAPADATRRTDAIVCLERSLKEICRSAAEEPALEVIVEPLDVAAHKRQTLGTTAEAVDLCARLACSGVTLRLCLDTAHMTLNGEDLVQAVRIGRAHSPELHFCNCVTDPAHPLYGDRHLPFGPPGGLDISGIGALMRAFAALGYLSPSARPRVFCEVTKRRDDEPLDVLAAAREALETGWALASAAPIARSSPGS